MNFRSLMPFHRAKPPARGDWQSDPFLQLQSEMNHLFDDTFSGFGLAPAFSSTGFGAPKLDIQEKNGQIEISAELPGVAEDEVEVNLADGVLTIRGEKKLEKEDRGEGGYYMMERSYGSFSRSIPLPFDVDEDAIEASFDKGVLKVQFPKPAEIENKTRKIPIRPK